MFRVFLAGWLLALLEIGCGGASSHDQRQPAGGGGTGGSASAEQAGAAPVAGAPNCTCVDAELGWWRDGGLVAYHSQSRVSSCASYTFNGPNPTTFCSSTLDGCGARLGVDDLNVALARPGVQAALVAAPVLYGGDPRPIDGQVAHIEVDGKVIEVGSPCDSDPNCQIPEDVDRFRRLLDELEMAEQGTNCTLK